MNIVLLPAIRLMQKLRLLPKFLLVSIVFIVPLALVVTLLFKELQKSLTQTRQAQSGLQSVMRINALSTLAQQYRARHYIALSSQRHNDPAVAELAARMDQHIDELELALSSDKVGAEENEGNTIKQIDSIKAAWSGKPQDNNTKAKDAYTGDTTFIDQLRQLKTSIVDQSSLRLDPNAQTLYLMLNVLDTIPAITADLYTIGGRGGAYIDTGLLEPNEDVQLTSRLRMTEINVRTLKQAYTTMSASSPQWETALSPLLATMGDIDTFIARADDEVLKSYNQTSGTAFLEGAQAAIDRLSALSTTSAGLLEASLQDRLAHFEQRRNLIMGVIALTLLCAVYLLAGFYMAFSRQVTALTNAVNLAASGDLRAQAHPGGKDEIADLSHAFGNMNSSLSQLIAAVRSSVHHITSASAGIASGNNDLASRTQLQTNSLAETTSRMQAMDTTIHHNADHAAHAMELAQFASKTAIKGGEAVNDVISTMASIRSSSQKITDIISVIDSIAFQTNILALNAAVEAARAGEQGRGFAVVASEVRNLAQRSATAAREIKALINDSVNEVDTCSQQVTRAGHTMEEIVSSVKQVGTIIEEISAASKKQRHDIADINTAISQIGAITVKNIDLAEHTLAAANSLEEQATELSQAVGVFKLEATLEDNDLSTIYTASEHIGHDKHPSLAFSHQALVPG